MEKFRVLNIIATWLLIFVSTSCTEEKTIFFENGSTCISFTVINPAVQGNNIAYSTFGSYWDYSYEDRSLNFDFIGSDGHTMNKKIDLDYGSSKTWAGGLNPLIINYIPKCPEEKMVTFTMPDGQEIEVSGPTTFEWEINYETWEQMKKLGVWYHASIVAQSEYVKDGITLYGYGRVWLSIEDSDKFVYDKDTDTWYQDFWTLNPERWEK